MTAAPARHVAHVGGDEEARRADDGAALGVGSRNPLLSSLPVALEPPSQGPGLFLGHNVTPTRLRPELPVSVPNWPELHGDVIGFRPAEACGLAAAWFPRVEPLPEVERTVGHDHWLPLNDGSGRAVDTETGELVRLVSSVELFPGRAVTERKIVRRLVIAGGKVAIECGNLGAAERADEELQAALAMQHLLDQIDTPLIELTDAELAELEARPWNVVTEFSRKARQRLRQRVAEADWWTPLQVPGTRIGMLTLTYSGDWETWAPDPETITKHRHALEERLRRALGYMPSFFWVREFQHRGAPHFHLAGVWPARINGEPLQTWLSRNWYEIVGTGDQRHLDAGTRVDWSKGMEASDPNRLAAYFSAYSTGKDGKEYQHHPPEGWANPNGSTGRHWGYRGVDFARAEVRLDRDQMIEVQRFLRRYIASHKRTMRTRGLNGQRSRPVNRRWSLCSLVGLDTGFTFLTNDGPSLATAIARAIDQPPDAEENTWPPGQPRPLP